MFKKKAFVVIVIMKRIILVKKSIFILLMFFFFESSKFVFLWIRKTKIITIARSIPNVRMLNVSGPIPLRKIRVCILKICPVFTNINVESKYISE